jgi:hypothetical protein
MPLAIHKGSSVSNFSQEQFERSGVKSSAAVKYKMAHGGSTEAIEEENENNYGTTPLHVPLDQLSQEHMIQQPS